MTAAPAATATPTFQSTKIQAPLFLLRLLLQLVLLWVDTCHLRLIMSADKGGPVPSLLPPPPSLG